MQASTIVGTLALLLAALLIAGYAHSQDPAVPEAKAAPELKTMQEKVEEREAIRRAAVAEQQKRREEFNRRCSKPLKTAEELQECRSVYRQM
jgi:malic enzyme